MPEELNPETLTELTAEQAIQLVMQYEGADLSLYSLTSLSDEVAQVLAKHEGYLYLGGLTSLSDASAQALAKHKGDLFLCGLTKLSDAAAQVLAAHEGDIELSGLTMSPVRSDHRSRRNPFRGKTIVIAGDKAGSNLDKAVELGIEVGNEATLKQLIGAQQPGGAVEYWLVINASSEDVNYIRHSDDDHPAKSLRSLNKTDIAISIGNIDSDELRDLSKSVLTGSYTPEKVNITLKKDTDGVSISADATWRIPMSRLPVDKELSDIEDLKNDVLAKIHDLDIKIQKRYGLEYSCCDGGSVSCQIDDADGEYVMEL